MILWRGAGRLRWRLEFLLALLLLLTLLVALGLVAMLSSAARWVRKALQFPDLPCRWDDICC
ncbi:MAG: hypothetical protein J7M05_00520 [Anaerolineae bacterium]|nr:hypothetical protein [Anaerolineae bacterium]